MNNSCLNLSLLRHDWFTKPFCDSPERHKLFSNRPLYHLDCLLEGVAALFSIPSQVCVSLKLTRLDPALYFGHPTPSPPNSRPITTTSRNITFTEPGTWCIRSTGSYGYNGYFTGIQIFKAH